MPWCIFNNGPTYKMAFTKHVAIFSKNFIQNHGFTFSQSVVFMDLHSEHLKLDKTLLH